MTGLNGIIETALYVEDLARARAFYQDVFGLKPLLEQDGFCAYDVAGRSVLLLFARGQFLNTQKRPGGEIPPHDGTGPVHVAFAIDAQAYEEWESKLGNFGIAIDGRMLWARGGRSMFFRDPDEHLLELMTPGNWTTY
jgi:catechol 2,3-dioxygenase-like lactoylglutathione lyase family enzyme